MVFLPYMQHFYYISMEIEMQNLKDIYGFFLAQFRQYVYTKNGLRHRLHGRDQLSTSIIRIYDIKLRSEPFSVICLQNVQNMSIQQDIVFQLVFI